MRLAQTSEIRAGLKEHSINFRPFQQDRTRVRTDRNGSSAIAAR
jgi:hypothetical protein